MKRKPVKIAVISVVVLIVLIIGFAMSNRIAPLAMGHDEVNTPAFSSEAINGYDAVAYFTQNAAIKGDEKYIYNYKNADWYFASEENKTAFEANPENYMPQFGGYCAFAVSTGFSANPNPEVFEIVDGKLYFFADEDVRKTFHENTEENLANCAKNWH